MRLYLIGPVMRRGKQRAEEDGHGDEEGQVAWQRVSHDNVRLVATSFFHFDEFRAREKDPGEEAAHEGAVEEVEGETDFAEPEEVFVAEGAAEVGGEGGG